MIVAWSRFSATQVAQRVRGIRGMIRVNLEVGDDGMDSALGAGREVEGNSVALMGDNVFDGVLVNGD